ncbi:LysR family transcriptional regulator [Lichenifustis flavocetrariae]|uniref:LysR family transcriptional regulator n=1 Tax=Lichenifustis flavocetrariae TaxID=2949735 RepID=A0AA42CQU2_9HYPH|nr:LysR family transcriptional regulator [Lichenifustis flavocetrariae]MCW6511792.1 LysR family transcriptional regulator [Lichenifustis flavocetrariae]
MIPTSDFGALRAFVAVAEALSFSRAAKSLGVSSSALTQGVRRIEDRMGARLLNRTTRSVSLTEAGQALYDRVRPAIDELGTVMSMDPGVTGQLTGTVRINAFRIAADLFLTPMLARFARDHPGVVLDVTLDDNVVDIVAAGYDAAIRLGELIERDMVALRLGPELRQVAVAAPSYLAEHGAPVTPRDLLAHNCIRWRWPGHERPYAWEFCEDGRWFAVEVSGSLIASSREFGVRAAVDGVGVAFAVEEAIAPFVEDNRLVRLLEPWSAPFPGFHLCYPQQRNMAPALRAFVDALRSPYIVPA